METLRDTYRDDDDEDTEKSNSTTTTTTNNNHVSTNTATTPLPSLIHHIKEEDPDISDELSEEDSASEDEDDDDDEEEPQVQQSPIPIVDLLDEDESPSKKQKTLSSFSSETPLTMPLESVVIASTPVASSTVKKPKKKNNNNVWTKPTSRKGKKKTKPNTPCQNISATAPPPTEDTVLITPIPRFPDRSDDSPDMKICLSKSYKAEKVELSDDRMSAGSCKGYRMVRATRGVVEGAWYFEIKVSKLGETGHTRLGWSMDKGDLQAPVGYDANSFGYRNIDGSKVHKALREKYGEEGYVEGDVIGFYINLPDGELYAPKPPNFVWWKGQRYTCSADGKEESLKIVPGSEMCFFRNGICQGVAFKELYGGRYYPAASMYTLPNQPNCMVKFNFGPDFEYFPQDFNGCPLPRPMIEVPYLSFDAKVQNGLSAVSNVKEQ